MEKQQYQVIEREKKTGLERICNKDRNDGKVSLTAAAEFMHGMIEEFGLGFEYYIREA